MIKLQRLNIKTPVLTAKSAWMLGVLLVALIMMAYQQVWHAGFIWDDDAYVTRNPTLRDLHGLWRIWGELSATPQYYPLVHTSFWLEYHAWGLNPLGYHLTNVVLHALAAVLLWRVLVKLKIPGAWLGAVIFALHPVEVESVAWITERKNVLSGVFYFGAALAYLRFELERDEGTPKRAFIYLVSLVLFVCALLSKTVACSLPAALLLMRWWKKGRLNWRDAVPLIPFFVIGVGMGLLTAWMEQHYVRAQGAEWSYTFVDRCLIAGRIVWFYAFKLLWPAKLTFIYPHWEISADSLVQWLFPLSAIAGVVALWFARKRIGRGPIAATLFFIGTLFPALGFFNVYPFRYSFTADHFQYLASVGLIVLLAAGIKRATGFFRGKKRLCFEIVVSSALILLLATLTWRQTGIYRSSDTLWSDTLAKNPTGWIVHNGIATNLLEKGQVAEALLHLRQALESNPNNVVTHSNLGYALLVVGRLGESLEHLEKALEINPNYSGAHANIANTLLQMGRTEQALAHLRKALELEPGDAEAQKNMAWFLATTPQSHLRDGTQAIKLAESAERLTDGRDATVEATLAAAYAEVGRFADAIKTAEHAFQLAVKSGNTALAEGIRAHVASYRSGQPVRDVR
jgi:tetratricopeptide (TPR) repeat protein